MKHAAEEADLLQTVNRRSRVRGASSISHEKFARCGDCTGRAHVPPAPCSYAGHRAESPLAQADPAHRVVGTKVMSVMHE